MEKVFQINLSGMLFTIEEQAYLKLKDYLDRLHRHFAGNSEIVLDIEGRMAELFARRLEGNRKTLLSEDVEEVTRILGDINQMDNEGNVKADAGASGEQMHDKPKPKHLRRNPHDQTLGGVCSGIASFFDLDPVLIRVIFVIMLVAYGSGVLLYLILWIVIPEAKNEEAVWMREQRNKRHRRLFRDADNRVIGGVAAGLSAYFGIDRTWIRLAFVVSVFLFGTGFWLYVILWIIVPKALSATDKLLMRGEAVDIYSIEREFMQSSGGNRMNSIVQHSGNLFGKIIRGFLKMIVGIISLCLFFTIVGVSIALVAVFFNLGDTHFINELIHFTVRDQSVIAAAKVGVLLCILIPLVALLLLFIKLLFKVQFLNRNWALSLGGLFLMGAFCLVYAGTSFASSVSHTESRATVNRMAKSDTLYLTGIDMPFSDEDEEPSSTESEIVFRDKGVVAGKFIYYFELDDVKIKQAKTDSIVLRVTRRANGNKAEDALSKLEMIDYKIEMDGNKIIIPTYFNLSKDKQFSWQEVDVTLWIPEGVIIAPDMNLLEILDDTDMDEADGSYFTMKDGQLKCLDCTEAGDEGDWNNEDSDKEDADVDFSIKDDKKGVDIEFKIDGDGEHDGKTKKTRKIIHKGNKEIIVEETIAGPVKITKKTEKK